jgi:hypothetical protein
MEYQHARDAQQLWFSIYAETAALGNLGEVSIK